MMMPPTPPGELSGQTCRRRGRKPLSDTVAFRRLPGLVESVVRLATGEKIGPVFTPDDSVIEAPAFRARLVAAVGSSGTMSAVKTLATGRASASPFTRWAARPGATRRPDSSGRDLRSPHR